MPSAPHSPASRPAPLTERDIDELQALLDRVPAPLEPLDVSMLDGFLCGVLLQPQQVPASQWLPHLTDADGREWTVELGNPRRTADAGFTEATAKPGDRVTILGNRALDGQSVMKAVRITLNGTDHDFYPERIDS